MFSVREGLDRMKLRSSSIQSIKPVHLDKKALYLGSAGIMVEPCGFTASKSKVRTILELTHSEGVVAEQRVDNRRLEFVTVGGSRIKPSRVVVSLCSTIVTFTWMVTLEWTSTLLGGGGGVGSAIPSTASCHKGSMPA